jgi:signal transduction histidine kinase
MNNTKLIRFTIIGALSFLISFYIILAKTHFVGVKELENAPDVVKLGEPHVIHQLYICQDSECDNLSVQEKIELVKLKGTPSNYLKSSMLEHKNYKPINGVALHYFNFILDDLTNMDLKRLTIQMPVGNYSSSEWYVDGRIFKYEVHGQVTKPYIKIPIALAKKHRNFEVFRNVNFRPSDTGVNTRGKFTLAQESHFNRMPIAVERTQHTHPLLFLSVKLGILLVIALTYLFTHQSSLILSFLALATFQITEQLMIGTWFDDYVTIKERAYVFFACQILSYYFVYRFYQGLSQKTMSSTLQKTLKLILVAFLIFITADYFLNLNYSIKQKFEIMGFGNVIFLFSASIVLFFSVKDKIKETFNLRSTLPQLVPFIIISLYAVMYFYATLTKDRELLSYRNYFDLLVFINASLFTIKGFVDLRKDLKARERELANKNINSLIGSQASKVVHDLRKPLSAMKNFLEDFDSMDSDEIIKRIDLMKKSISSSETQIQSILTQKRKLRLDLEYVEIKTWLPELIEKLKFENTQIQYNVDLGSIPDVGIFIEKDTYEACVQNIFVNAIEAMSGENTPNPSIKIEVLEDTNQHISISIENNGPKIPDNYLKKIFDIGYTKGKKSGNGIGLSASYEGIAKHGYVLQANNINTGVRFTIPCGTKSVAQKVLNEISAENKKSSVSLKKTERAQDFDFVYLIEDDELIITSWKFKWKGDDRLRIYRKPSDFVDDIENKSISLSKKSLVVTDYHFETEPHYNGLALKYHLDMAYGFQNCILNSGDSSVSISGLKEAFETKSAYGPKELLDVATAIRG